jgi:hypothetical protein
MARLEDLAAGIIITTTANTPPTRKRCECFFCDDLFDSPEEVRQHQLRNHLEKSKPEPHHHCTICQVAPPMDPDGHFSSRGLVEAPNFDGWVPMRRLSRDGRSYLNDREIVWICPSCAPVAFEAVQSKRQAPKPQGSTEPYPDDLDLVAGDVSFNP